MKNLARLRKTRGFTQCELGEAVGSDGNSVSRYERGIIHPSVELIQRFADFFGVSVDEILNGPARNELKIVIDWEVKDVNDIAIKHDEAGFGYRANDDHLLYWGAIPATSDVDEVLNKIRAQLAASIAGRDAHRAALGKG